MSEETNEVSKQEEPKQDNKKEKRSRVIRGTVTFLSITIAALGGCASTTIPPVEPNGKYLQIHIQNSVIIEYEYDSPTACSANANQESGLNADSRRALASGAMKILCTDQSGAGLLKFNGTTMNTLTGKTINVRFISKEACMQMSKLEGSNNANVLKC